MSIRKPFYWLNKDSRKFLSRGYLMEGVTPEERLKEIGDTVERLKGIEGYSEKFMDYMSRGWISLSSPVWSNFGTPFGLGISCFSIDIQDDTSDILRAASEIGMMSKHGGGTGGYFGKLRSRGSSISGGGTSNGSISFMEIFESVINTISQSGVRRGSFAAYLPIDHEDFDEFMTLRNDDSSIQNMSMAVTIPEGWMEEMIEGDSEKRKRWLKVLQKRSETGFPYIFFNDNVNNNSPQVYRDKGIKINHSNLCIVGSDRVVSDRGYLTAKELFEQGGELTLFNGREAVKSSEMKLREKDVPVYKVTLSNGMSMTATDYHGMAVMDENGNITRVPLKDLTIGDYISIQTKKGLFGTLSMEDEAFLLGIFQSDGTSHKDIIMLDIWEDDFDLEDEIKERFDRIHYKYGCDKYKVYDNVERNREPAVFHECITGQSTVRKRRLSSKTLYKSLKFEKGFVPDWIWRADEKTQWQYVRGLLFADGTVHKSSSKGEPIQIAYADINKEFLKELQILFNNLGLSSSIRILRKAGKTLLPDGKGGMKYYNTKDCYRLIVGNKNDALEIERNTGFLSRKGIKIEDRQYRDNSKKRYQVKSIEFVGTEDVYCPTVYNDEHIFVCNGMLTFNCSEILLSTDDKESFVCCLSSLNLEHYDEWKDTDLVETVLILLDAVMEEFIQKASKIPFFEKAVEFAKNQNAVGLGVLGLHSFLQKNMLPMSGLPTKLILNQIFSNIRNKADEASKKYAAIWGEPPLLEGYSERWTTKLAIAPTTSSSMILGQVSPSIEPLNSNYFLKDVAKGKFVYKNPYLKRLLKNKDKDNDEVWDSILSKGGSVQHLEFLTENEKEVFKTFGEISQMEVVQNVAIIQKYIDQGISLNTMIHPDVPVRDINKLYIEGWKLGIKTFYYQRSSNLAQELSRNILECSSCEA